MRRRRRCCWLGRCAARARLRRVPRQQGLVPPLSSQGVDFYFANRAHAVKFIDFLQTVVPIRYRCAA